MMEQLAERRMQREDEAAADIEDDSEEDEEDEEGDEEDEEDQEEDVEDEEEEEEVFNRLPFFMTSFFYIKKTPDHFHSLPKSRSSKRASECSQFLRHGCLSNVY
jgi:hypothetical protein